LSVTEQREITDAAASKCSALHGGLTNASVGKEAKKDTCDQFVRCVNW